jgi:hypothetical protein
MEKGRSHRRALILTLAAMVLAACKSDASPSSRPSTAPLASKGVVATIRVTDQEYRIELTDSADIEIAWRLLRGEQAPGIPNGIVVRGDPGVNTGYSWHIDPTSFEFADATTEVCDGLPSDVEANAITSDRYCPWQAKVIHIAE